MSGTRINLLPHRELKRAARKREFVFVAAGTVIFALATAFLAHTILAGMVESQMNKNKFLKAEIAKVDKEIEEIQRLKEQTAALLARKQIVETLQANRTEAVHLLDQLVRQLPDGIYLKSVKQNVDKINLTGYAQSNARIATLMRNLDTSPWLTRAELVETKAVQLNSLRVNEFSLNIQLKRDQPPDAGKPAAKEKGA
ncbi:MAG: PilN domain-containing protein [Betaproteobacteria bacterium]|nr:PilN domain-containing protein [Betaproteobacteria bacterium]MBK9605835.1 PilN domain-containing protein [Betaproteobacteria bacterium]